MSDPIHAESAGRAPEPREPDGAHSFTAAALSAAVRTALDGS